jgi:hypothetical protein
MQNKAKFRKSQMNVSNVLAMEYEKMDTWSSGKTKPIQSQLKPIKANIMPKQTQYKPKRTQSNPILRSNYKQMTNQSLTNLFVDQLLLLPLTINTRPNPLDHFAHWRFLAPDQGPNLSYFVGLLFAHGLIFSEKKQQIPKIPDKAAAALGRFVYIKKTLVFLSGAMDNISRFSIEN